MKKIILLYIALVSISALSLDEAVAYSVAGKTCADEAQLLADKASLQDALKSFENTEAVRSRIDLLKQVRELINKAKASIIKVDSLGPIALIQTSDFTSLLDNNYDDVFELITIMETTENPVDKVALCDTIIQKIDELIFDQETLIAKPGYDTFPQTIQSNITSIDNFIAECQKPKEDPNQYNGSAKVITVEAPKEDKVVDQNTSGKSEVSLKVDNGESGSVDSVPAPPAPVVDSGAGAVSLKPEEVNDNTEISDDKTEGSIKVNTNASLIQKKSEALVPEAEKSEKKATGSKLRKQKTINE